MLRPWIFDDVVHIFSKIHSFEQINHPKLRAEVNNNTPLGDECECSTATTTARSSGLHASSKPAPNISCPKPFQENKDHARVSLTKSPGANTTSISHKPS